MEVEHEDTAFFLKGENLVVLVLAQAARHAALQHVVFLDHRDHRLVKVAQQLIAQITVLRQAPQSARMRKAPAVALAREIDPFRDGQTRCP